MKKYNILFLSVITLLSCFSLKAQEFNDFKNPVDDLFLESPDVMAFQKHNFMPANLYTGKVDVKIPIYEIDFSGIKIPISLDYDTGGNKVDELASSVGLGWSLNAGGNIVHIVKDVPDSKMIMRVRSKSDVYFMGYHRRLYDYDLTSILNPNSYYANRIDASPDIYHIVAPNLQGKFILLSDDPIQKDIAASGKHNLFNRTFKSYFLENKGYKIDDSDLYYSVYDAPNILNDEYDSNSIFKDHTEAKYIDHFSIKNTNGLIYEFRIGNVTESDGVGETSNSSGFLAYNGMYTKEVRSWNLHSITNPITGKKVEFEYEIYEDKEVEISISLRRTYNTNDRNFVFFPRPSSFSPKSPITQVVYPRKTRLKKIKFDKGEVEFEYKFHRQDYHDKALSNIIIKDYNGKRIKGFRLRHDYFYAKENCNDKICKRLKLLDVREVDRDDIEDEEILKKYVFEYNESIQLPKRRFSFEKDYLGYYNRNGQGYFAEGNDFYTISYQQLEKFPKLYYYPNQYELSVLPFKKVGALHTNPHLNKTNPTGMSLEPDFQGTLATSLKKITYPTGGTLELEYENHKFYFEGHTYNAPGLRIKKQILNDGKGDIQTYFYTYEQSTGASSGYFNSMPVFGDPNTITPDIDNIYRYPFDYHIDPKYGIELTHGSFIGYSRVKEEQVGNGYKIYNYSSPKDYKNTRATKTPKQHDNIYTDFLIKNSAFPGKLYIDNDIKRGKLKRLEIYDVNHKRVYSESNDYEYKSFEEFELSYVDAVPYQLNSSLSRKFNNTVDFDKDLSKTTTFTGNLILEEAKLYVERNLLKTSVKTFDYDSSTSVHNTSSNNFHTNLPLITKQTFSDHNGRTEIYDYTYPFQKSDVESNLLTSLNIIENPIEIKKTQNNGQTVQNKNFKIIDGLPFLASLSTQKGNSPEDTNVTFDKYDTEGNILQYTNKEQGLTTCILWGYHKNYPIAKIEGDIDYDMLNQVLQNNSSSFVSIQTQSDTEDTEAEETALKTALNQMRNQLNTAYPSLQITTYTYDPLIGITSMTDTRGRVMEYKYDKFNRLVHVVDEEGNIVSKNEYNYKQ